MGAANKSLVYLIHTLANISHLAHSSDSIHCSVFTFEYSNNVLYLGSPINEHTTNAFIREATIYLKWFIKTSHRSLCLRPNKCYSIIPSHRSVLIERQSWTGTGNPHQRRWRKCLRSTINVRCECKRDGHLLKMFRVMGWVLLCWLGDDLKVVQSAVVGCRGWRWL